MALDFFKFRLALVAYTFILQGLVSLPSLPVSDSIRENLVWQSEFFSLWNGFFYMVYFMALIFFGATFGIIHSVVRYHMKRSAEFRQKIEERKAACKARRDAKLLAKGKKPQSPRSVYMKMAVSLVLSVVMTINCAVWNRVTDAPTVLEGSLSRFYEMLDISTQVFALELAIIAVILPFAVAFKVLRNRRRARLAAAERAAPETTEVPVPFNEKVLIDLSDGMEYVSEKMNLNQQPPKDVEEGLDSEREPLL